MDVGPRIRLARARAHMSLRDLAGRVGVSATAISKFERGVTSPRQSTLLALARSLSVGTEFFFREVQVETLQAAYRKHSTLGSHTQRSIEASIKEVVERHLIAEEYGPAVAECDLTQVDVGSLDEAEDAAALLREQWHLGTGPIEDLCGQLENAGVKVIPLDAGSTFDGYACWVNGSVPVIAFSSERAGDRQRFDLAHELGHLRMQVHRIDAEAAASRFAAAFLIPAAAAKAELGVRRSRLSFEELRLLKARYGVSMQAWIRRAFDLGIIDREVYTSLFRQMSSWGWRKDEPGEVRPEQPTRLFMVVHQALAEGRIAPSEAARLLQDAAPRAAQWPTASDLMRAAAHMASIYAGSPDLVEFSDDELD